MINNKKQNYNINLFGAEFPKPEDGEFNIVDSNNEIIEKNDYDEYIKYINIYLNESYSIYTYPGNIPVDIEFVEAASDYLATGKIKSESHIIEKLRCKYPDTIEKFKMIEGLEITSSKSGNIYNKAYNSFNTPLLLNEVLEIDLLNYNSIIKFCNTYGLLGDENLNNTPYTYFDKIDTKKISYFKVNLIYFLREVKKIKFYTILWKDMNNTFKLKKRISINKRKKIIKIDNRNITNKIINAINWEKEFYDLTPKIVAKILLYEGINDNLAGVIPKIQFSERKEIIPGYKAISLSGVIFAQLYDLITRETELKECLYCHKLFIPKHGSNRFCPKEKDYERSPCENKYNQMKYQVRKEYKGGKTVEEISQKKGRSVEEIKSWVNKKP